MNGARPAARRTVLNCAIQAAELQSGSWTMNRLETDVGTVCCGTCGEQEWKRDMLPRDSTSAATFCVPGVLVAEKVK